MSHSLTKIEIMKTSDGDHTHYTIRGESSDLTPLDSVLSAVVEHLATGEVHYRMRPKVETHQPFGDAEIHFGRARFTSIDGRPHREVDYQSEPAVGFGDV